MMKKMQGKAKKMIAVAAAVSMLGNQFFIPESLFIKQTHAAGFNMNGSKWAETYLRSLYDNGIMSGDTNGNMNPDNDITRAEFVTMLNKGMGYHETTGKVNFRDIKGTEWYANEIDIATTQGYFVGSGRNVSGASDNLTREQAVAFLTRNLKYEEDDRVNTDFVDGINFPTWSRGSINAATDKGVVSGYQDGTFRPKDNITRAEAGTILYNALGKIINQPGNYNYGTVDGNVTISKSGVTLSDTVINGDLYITEGVELGYTNLRNVTVKGQVIISGGGESNIGESSITFTDSTIREMIIDAPEDKPVSVKIDGSTQITNTKIKSTSYLEELSDIEGGFQNLELNGPEDTDLHLMGTYDKITVIGAKNNLYLNSGEINTLVIDETATDSTTTLDEDTYVAEVFIDVKTTINGDGDIGQVNINADEVVIAMLPDSITLRPGATATINGKKMTSKDAEEASSFPRILGKYPKLDEVEATRVSFIVQTNKPGTIYWAVTESDSGSVSDDDLLKPNKRKDIVKSGSMNIPKSNTDYTITVSGLTKDADYIFTAALVDDRDDMSTRERKSFTTTDNTSPQYLSSSPKISETTNTTVTISAITNKDLTTYWALFPTGSLAPTQYEVRRGKLSGNLAKGTITDCKKNIEFNFGISGLEEKQTYDLYIVGNDGEKDTAMKKITFTTADQTPPEFMEDYPKPNKLTKNSVEVLYKINEDAKVYYVVMDRGEDFPPPPVGSTTIPPLTSDEAKQAVVNGTTGVSKGSGTAKMETEGSVNVTRLQEQIAYDLYMVAVDNDGNMSDIEKILIKTLDEIPPTAEQEFTEMMNEYPAVSSDVRIVFSEEVKVIEDSEFVDLSPENLKNHITLYDITTTERKTVDINFDRATVTLEKGKTVITFPSRAIPMSSGSKYQFELNKITDTSNNKMEDKTMLPEFRTVPSLVSLVQTIAPQNYDVTFTATPQSNDTNDELLYDMLIYSDSNITFDLYEKGPNDTDFRLLTGTRIDLNTGQETDYDAQINASDSDTGINGISLHYILDRVMHNEPTYLFERFNQLEAKEYAIKVRSIDGKPESAGWTANVNISIKCVVGSRTTLQPAAGAPIKGFEDAIKAGALEVTNPMPFSMTIPFTDTVVPKFIENYPMLDPFQSTSPTEFPQNYLYVGDYTIRPRVQTDKPATMYYMILPHDNVENATITNQDVYLGNISDDIAIKGRYSIPNAYLIMDDLEIEGLTPDTEYIMYSVLKGTPADPSALYINRFKTKPLVAPVINPIIVTNRTNSVDSRIIEVTVDKDCQLFYVVYPTKTSDSSNGYAPGEIEAEQIKNGFTTPSNQPLVYSSTKIEVDPDIGRATVELEIKGLKPGVKYILHAVARNWLGTSSVLGQDSDVKCSEEFGALDVTPPGIRINYSINPPEYDKDALYSGAVTISSDEALYYQDTDGSINPLTYQVLLDKLDVNPKRGELVINPQGRATETVYRVSQKDVKMKTARDIEGRAVGQGIYQFTVSYTNAPLGATSISFPHPLCDVEGNVIGSLYLTLTRRVVPNEILGTNEYWVSWMQRGLDTGYVTIVHPDGTVEGPTQ